MRRAYGRMFVEALFGHRTDMKLTRPEPRSASMMLMVFGFVLVLVVLLVIGVVIL